MVKLILTMILKNEEKIIVRLLDSVKNIIDGYVICDTGSSDNTINIIKEYVEKNNLIGCLYEEPFINFGYNRTHVFNKAKELFENEYALLIDADMILEINNFNINDLKHQSYCLIQYNNNIEYWNKRIIKLVDGVKCVGATHEYWDTQQSFNLDTIKIKDIGDGGAKSDKYLRDIRLLTNSLKEDPNNARTYFYLANSYRDIRGQDEKAIFNYKKRIELGGWIEEMFYSAYEIGNIYHCRLNDNEKAVYWWLEAYRHDPRRNESIYELYKYYKGRSVELSNMFKLIGLKIPYPKNCVLFICKYTYHNLFLI
jgi:tetratricopeptide (TPR) repeat protein